MWCGTVGDALFNFHVYNVLAFDRMLKFLTDFVKEMRRTEVVEYIRIFNLVHVGGQLFA